MTTFKKYIPTLLLSFVLISIINCSTQHNTLVSRNMHKLSTKYNVVFNGEEALQKELQQIHDNYHDNFFQLLSVEQFDAKYEIFLPGQQASNANLDRAEEKAVKAIQKHSMEIRGVQENNQIDNAYLLLGKSRYYQKRFLAAMDAFNYEIDNDFKSNIRPMFKFWREKTNIRMDNNEQAIRNLLYIARQDDTPKELKAEAFAYAAQAQINIDSFSKAIENLQNSIELIKNKEHKARYLFITAQLLEKINLRDSAISYLQQIEEKKRPRKYSLQAELYRYHLSLDKKDQHPEMLKALYTKHKRYEYHKFYNYIDYEIGEIFHSEDSLTTAVDFYTKAARSQDKQLKEKAYEQMTAIGFQKKDYLMAGAYLDSLLQVMPHETLKYLKTKHKRNNIDDIIKLEKSIKRNDSIMVLVQADSLKRVELIQAYIDELKAKEAESLNKEEVDYSKVTPKYTSFYFYNKALVDKGKVNFKEVWGDVSLADLWRLKNKMSFEEDEETDADTDNTSEDKEDSNDENENVPDKYKVSFYYKKIPTKPKTIDSILGNLNYAHYQVGMLYYEKFKELEKGKEHLEKMLASNPKQELIPPAKYNLYKIYQNLGKKLLAEHLANEILSNYPESIYADLIKNPDKISERSNKAFQDAYTKIYDYYKQQKYDSLLNASDPMLLKFSFHPELGKVELLRATAIARSEGIEAYEKALNSIILKYPKSPYEEDAKKRMVLVNKYKKKIYTNAKSDSYKLVILHDIFDPATDSYVSCIENVLVQNKSTHLKISKDPFNRQQSFIVVHNFLSDKSASYLADLLQNTTCTPQKYFIISSDNYKTLQLTKRLKAYMDFIKEQTK